MKTKANTMNVPTTPALEYIFGETLLGQKYVCLFRDGVHSDTLEYEASPNSTKLAKVLFRDVVHSDTLEYEANPNSTKLTKVLLELRLRGHIPLDEPMEEGNWTEFKECQAMGTPMKDVMICTDKGTLFWCKDEVDVWRLGGMNFTIMEFLMENGKRERKGWLKPIVIENGVATRGKYSEVMPKPEHGGIAVWINEYEENR